jgi:hypothetical protein
MKKLGPVLFALLATLVLAPAAGAQICAGFPTADRQFSFGGSVFFPEELDQFSIEASYNLMGPLSLFGGMTILEEEQNVGEIRSDETFEFGAAFDFPAVGQALGAGFGVPVSACPVVAVNFTDVEGQGSITRFPLGFGIGASLPVGTNASLLPYVIPQVVFSRFDFDEEIFGQRESESETDFALRAGALVGFGMFYLGGEVGQVFREGRDALFGIRGGIRL